MLAGKQRDDVCRHTRFHFSTTRAMSLATVSIEPEERQFANLGAALQRGREMYRAHESSAIGFRICNALGEIIHEWKR